MNAIPPAGPRPEVRFEDRLLTAILADFENLTAPDAPAPAPRPHRARSPLPAGRLASSAAAAALVAVGAIALHGHAAGSPAAGASVASAHPRLLTTAYVIARVKAALNANTAVLVTVSRAPDSQTGVPVTQKIWSSPRSATTRSESLDSQGRPVTGYVLTITGHTTVSVQISYRDRTWSTVTYPFGSAPSGSAPVPGPLPQTPEQQATRLRAAVAAGKLTVVGRATIDGQPAIELRSGSVRSGVQEIWISPASYLPVREIDTAPGQSPASPQSIRNDYTWLPGTPANLRLLSIAAAIPAGFTKVSHAHQDGRATRR